MKNFSKIIPCVAASLFFVSAAFAQTDPTKETVIVNPFTSAGSVGKAATGNIRAAVLSGISDRGRFHIVDAETDGILSKLYNGRTAEDVVNDANWKTESEAAYKTLGADKLIIGQANNLSSTSYLDDAGTRWNKLNVTFTLKVYNIADGAMVGSEDFAVEGLSQDSADGAFDDAMRDVRFAMRRFVDQYFKFETYILELGEADKKGNVKQLYISGGTEMGIEKNTRFKVFSERKVGPKVMRTEIGTIVAEDVSDGITLCDVSKGGEVIKDKFNSGEGIVVVADRSGTLAGETLRGLNPFRK
jgi:hypothetical protein